MKEHLQAWYSKWLREYKDTDLLYVQRSRNGVYLEQVHFVRDQLGRLMYRDLPYEQLETFKIVVEEAKNPYEVSHVVSAYVVGEHMSKSVRLPVYMLERPDLGLRLVMRDNYYDWNIAIESDTPVPREVLDGIRLDTTYCFFQGFPSEYRHGSYELDPTKFAICVGSSYDAYIVAWNLKHFALRAAGREAILRT